MGEWLASIGVSVPLALAHVAIGIVVLIGVRSAHRIGLRKTHGSLWRVFRRAGGKRRGLPDETTLGGDVFYEIPDHSLRHYGVREGDPDDADAYRRPAVRARYRIGLQGRGWQQGALRRNTTARLVFSQKSLDRSDTIATIMGQRLDDAAGRDGRFLILVTPPAGLAFASSFGVAQFHDGRLVADVVFDMAIAGDCAAAVEIGIEFFGRTRLYGVKLKVAVADPGAETEACSGIVPADIDLDAADAVQDASVLLKVDASHGELHLMLIHAGAGGSIEYAKEARVAGLAGAALQAVLDGIGAELGPDFFSGPSWRTHTPSGDDLERCRERAASAGSLLHRRLATQGAEALFAYIDALPEGTRIVIVTSGVFLPFELIYPAQFRLNWPKAVKAQHPVDAGGFWGVRFAIEIVHGGEGDYRSLQRRHRDALPSVSVNIDPDLARRTLGALSIVDDLTRRLGERHVACTVNTTCDEKRSVLLSANGVANIIYVYCHGAAAADGESESLSLDSDCRITPFDAVPGRRHPWAPVIILNACHSGAASPLLFTGFLRMFRSQDALGVIATSFYVPIEFGAVFGAELVEACVAREHMLSERVRRLRQHYAQQGNPVPLFYSVQCQLEGM